MSKRKVFFAALLLTFLLPQLVLAAVPKNKSASSTPERAAKIKVDFMGVVREVNGANYVVDSVKTLRVGQEASSTLASTVTVKTKIKTNSNKPNKPAKNKKNKNKQQKIVNAKAIKAGDRVLVSGFLNNDGTIQAINIRTRPSGKK